jgi:quinol monooxygenase YgiN
LYFHVLRLARNPNEFVIAASWKSEKYINQNLRRQPWFKDTQARMLDCCTGPMIMGQLA